MRILVIPDVHQTSAWKDIFLSKQHEFDFVVQLGDWFDTHDEHFSWKRFNPIENFNEAVELSKTNEKFKICLGNHDFSYLLEQHCSQFQEEHYEEIKTALTKNLAYVNIAYEFDGWVLSHAGFSKTWMETYNFTTIQQVNNAFHKGYLSIFRFQGYDQFGDYPTNGPTWIRPAALYVDAFFKYQIVGHTPVDNTPLIICKQNNQFSNVKQSIDGQKIILIDSEIHDCFYELDTEKQKL